MWRTIRWKLGSWGELAREICAHLLWNVVHIEWLVYHSEFDNTLLPWASVWAINDDSAWWVTIYWLKGSTDLHLRKKRA
jgi:hypothetical protein